MSNTSNVVLTVTEVRNYMLKHYEQGGHMLIECWSDNDIQLWLNKRKRTENSLKKLLKELNGESSEFFLNVNW